jgi:integrase
MTRGADGRRTIGEPKSKASRTDLHLSPKLVGLLTAQRERTGGDGYVFPNELGGATYTRTVAKVLDATTARLGLPRLHVHRLRHTFATLQMAAGADAISLARQIGHSDPALIYRTYGHPVDARVREVAHGIDALLDGAR